MSTRFALWVVFTAACFGDHSDAPDAATPPGVDGGAEDPDAAAPRLVPSNADAVGELAPTGLVVTPPDGMFSTTADCTTPSVLGACARVEQPGGAALCVCRADRIAIHDLRVVGARGLVLLAWDEVTIDGDLVLGASGSAAGPGSTADYATTAASLDGGAGGSFGTSGAGGAAANPRGTPELEPLVAGMAGQAGCNNAAGGGGGGALQITARAAITVTGTISAGGGGGAGGSSSGTCIGGAGGGSGGAILLEAPAVVTSGAMLANGGGGGGGGSNDHGGGGRGADAIGTPAAAGGWGNDDNGCPLYGYTIGGDGGWGATATNAPGIGASWDSISGCIGGTTYTGSGGAGGGLGRIRVNTAGGCQCGGAFSPAPSIGTVRIE